MGGEIRLLQGDCLDLLPSLAAASVQLVLCDLPYGQTQNAWDSIIPFEGMWKEVWRVCSGAAIFTAMQPFSSALVMSQPGSFRHEWVWEKNKATGHLNAKRSPLRAHELALVFAKSAPTYFPQMTDGHLPANTVFRRGHDISNYGAQKPSERYGGSTLRYPRSVIRFPVVNNDDPQKVHPTQKPVDLMRYFIETYSAPGDTVLDFCMGSGTTALASLQAGRNFIGIELNPAYVEIARRRIEADAGMFAAVS